MGRPAEWTHAQAGERLNDLTVGNRDGGIGSALEVKRLSPVFIVGCGRSGTTLLRLMLNAHPMLAIPGESHFIRYLWSKRRAYGSRGHFVPDRLVDDMVNDSNFRLWGIPAEAVRRRIEALEKPNFAGVVAAAFMAYAEAQGKPRWGDKTPIYVLSIPMLAGLFSGAKFLHLIRDGRDVALSYLSMPMFGGGIWEASWRWSDWVIAGIRSGRNLGPARYMELKYEHLVSNPRAELERVCAFVDLEFDPGMLGYYVDAHRRLQAPPDRVPFHSRTSLPPQTHIRDWRTEMPVHDVEIFESVAGDLLEELGYERRFRPVRLPLRVRAYRKTAVHRMYVKGSRVKRTISRGVKGFSVGRR